MATTQWDVIDAQFPLWVWQYSFGTGIANALAVGIEGGWAVVSPPCNAPEAAYQALKEKMPVKALVASNAFHHLGLPAWKQHFPDAGIYAPAQALPRIEKQSGLSGIKPVSELAALAGPRVDFIDLPHYRTKLGELLVRARTDSGCVWYATDIVMNIPKLPLLSPFGLLFRLTNTAPGFRFGNLPAMLMVRDKPALKRFLLETAEQSPPALIVPAHGTPLKLGQPLNELRALMGM
jgi:hypothetical protein